MKPYVPYRDIPKPERKALASEVYRKTPSLRVTLFASIIVPMVGIGLVADRYIPRGTSLGTTLVIKAVSVLVIFILLWESVGQPRLKSAVERLKNGH